MIFMIMDTVVDHQIEVRHQRLESYTGRLYRTSLYGKVMVRESRKKHCNAYGLIIAPLCRHNNAYPMILQMAHRNTQKLHLPSLMAQLRKTIIIPFMKRLLIEVSK